MHLALDKKIVLVTGGTKGIGLAIVHGFLAEGATVYFCSRTEADVKNTSTQLSLEYPGARAVGSVVDVGQQSQLAAWVADCAKAEDRIDVVVGNVSALSFPDTAESWLTTFNVDMMGTYHLIHEALPYLEASKGNIITIASVSGRDIDCIAVSPYGAIKAALIHYTAQLANRLAPKGVRANSVSPGNTYVADGAWGNIERTNPEMFKSQMALNVMGRMARPDEVANAVVFLASEKASFISGANLNVDGALCTGVQF